MKYKKYELDVLRDQAGLKSLGFLRGKATADKLEDAMAQWFLENLQQFHRVAIMKAIIECDYLRHDRLTIFPESNSLIDGLLKSTFNAVDDSAFPCEIGVVMMPKKSSLDSFMYAITDEEYEKKRSESFFKRMGEHAARKWPERKGEIEEKFLEPQPPAPKTLYIIRATKMAGQTKKIISSTPIGDLLDNLRKDPEWTPFTEMTHENRTIPFRDADRILSEQTIRLALAQIVYRVAKPELIRNGVPDVKAMAGITTSKGRVLRGFEESGSMRGTTLVGAFFRQLRADRYYQGEYSDVPKGSRWAFVKPHLRGGKPITIEE